MDKPEIKKRKRKKKNKKPKIEFTKLLVAIVNIFGILWVEQSYILAFMGYDSNSEVTVTIVSALLGVVNSGYFLKSFGEKNSMNKFNYHEDFDYDDVEIVNEDADIPLESFNEIPESAITQKGEM
jgi:hypothetical protein